MGGVADGEACEVSRELVEAIAAAAACDDRRAEPTEEDTQRSADHPGSPRHRDHTVVEEAVAEHRGQAPPARRARRWRRAPWRWSSRLLLLVVPRRGRRRIHAHAGFTPETQVRIAGM